jgi:hypothetical protein
MKKFSDKIKIFMKQVKIYIRLQKNYRKIAKKKSLYFYIYTMPIFGFFLSFILKFLILFNSKKLTKLISHKIFLSTIRYIDPVKREQIANSLPKYNSPIELIDNEKMIADKKLRNILDDLNEKGFCYLGKIFSKKDCEDFKNQLKDKICYNSQTEMQSDGIPLKFDSNKRPFNEKNSAYFCFDASVTLSFKPLKEFLENKNLTNVINNYLNFPSSIYNISTWYNPPSNEQHYVHRSHRDYDDFKFLGMVIYWNDIEENNGPLTFVKKSHKDKNIFEPHTKLIGEAGSVYLVDTFGLHSGSPVKQDARYTTSFRFGQYFNMASVNNGFVQTP